MRSIKLIGLLCLIAILSCEHFLDLEEDVPQCIHDKIKGFSHAPFLSDSANVKRYQYQGIIVYVFDYGNCYNCVKAIYDEQCDNLCTLEHGEHECNGQLFYEKATDETLIWEP